MSTEDWLLRDFIERIVPLDRDVVEESVELSTDEMDCDLVLNPVDVEMPASEEISESEKDETWSSVDVDVCVESSSDTALFLVDELSVDNSELSLEDDEVTKELLSGETIDSVM